MESARALSALLVVAVLGCGGEGGGEEEAGGADAAPGRDGGPGEAGDLAVACVAPDEPTYQPWSDGEPQVPLCEAPDRVALPSGGVLRDVSHVAAGDPGTCGDHEQGGRGVIEIDTADGFPQWIRLPEAPGRDPACSQACDLGPQDTAFGITFRMSSLPPDGMQLAVRVEAPWYWLTGDEYAATACLDGRPTVLEYGQPLACSTFPGGDFGLATDDPDAAGSWAVIDVIEPTGTPNCCPYTCAPPP